MQKLSVSQEQGEAVIIERKGARFLVTLAPAISTGKKASIEVLDRNLLEHGWSWTLGDGGLVLGVHKAKRKKR